MVQAVELEMGAAFVWQNEVYRVIDHVSYKDGGIETVTVQCVGSKWTKDLWRTVTGRQSERFNPYCEVEPVTLSLIVAPIEE